MELQDKIRKEMLEVITRSYDDKYPVSYLMIELIRINEKFCGTPKIQKVIKNSRN